MAYREYRRDLVTAEDTMTSALKTLMVFSVGSLIGLCALAYWIFFF